MRRRRRAAADRGDAALHEARGPPLRRADRPQPALRPHAVPRVDEATRLQGPVQGAHGAAVPMGAQEAQVLAAIGGAAAPAASRRPVDALAVGGALHAHCAVDDVSAPAHRALLLPAGHVRGGLHVGARARDRVRRRAGEGGPGGAQGARRGRGVGRRRRRRRLGRGEVRRASSGRCPGRRRRG